MQFVYHENSSDELLTLDGEFYNYLIKVRRHNINETIWFRNMKDDFLYEYKIESISKRDAKLLLVNSVEKKVEATQESHLAWCVVDTKTIEKTLPFLNELGIKKLSFVYADYSQKNFKLNFEKYNKILINSSQQSGRSSLMELKLFKSVDEFLKIYPKSYMFNFSQNTVDEQTDIQTIIIGCEGGFSKREIALFESSKIVGIKTNLILRSETAVTLVGSKLLV
ncbi:MAG: 16S rRNA (uracil(1498)-N(3))-methyltransferase [Arcobacteraceae bacterium]